MAKRNDKEFLEDLPGKFRSKMKKRSEKKRPKMRVSGKGVFQLKKIFRKRK